MSEQSAKNDLQPLVEYYRKRASDVEYEFLQFQIAASKEIESLRSQLASQAALAEPVADPAE